MDAFDDAVGNWFFGVPLSDQYSLRIILAKYRDTLDGYGAIPGEFVAEGVRNHYESEERRELLRKGMPETVNWLEQLERRVLTN